MTSYEHKVKNIYLGSPVPVYPLESIVTKQKANSSGMIYIPYGDTNWKVSIDDVVVQTGGTATSFSGYTADSEHIVAIEPITVSYGRAKNYKWYNKTGAGLVIEIIKDQSYIGFADSATNTGTDFRRNEYGVCSNLINTAEEYLPDTVTTIGVSFRYGQYYGCSKITEASEEVLPDTVTSIGTGFRAQQFYECSKITETPIEVLPDTVTSIGTDFRSYQFYKCTSITSIKGWKDSSYGGTNYRDNQFDGCTSQKTVKVLSDVGYSAQSDTLSRAYVTEVQVPNTYLSNFTSTTTVYPRRSIDDSKFVGY